MNVIYIPQSTLKGTIHRYRIPKADTEIKIVNSGVAEKEWNICLLPIAYWFVQLYFPSVTSPCFHLFQALLNNTRKLQKLQFISFSLRFQTTSI